MGVVFRAEEVGLQRPVALKLISPEYAGNRELRTRLLNEARLAAQIEHPSAVPIYRAGEADGHIFIAMQLVEGRSLAEEIQVRGRLAPGRAFALVGQIAGALDTAHGLGVVHRDVSPGNILLTGSGDEERAVLVDFGISVRTAPGGAPQQLAGTPAYLAPECTRGAPADARSDTYSLACCAYAALTGKPPFTGERDAVIDAQRNEAPAPLSSGCPTTPMGSDLLMARALSKLPGDRFSTAGAFAEALLSLRDDVLVVSADDDLPHARALASSLCDRGLGSRAESLTAPQRVAEMLASTRACVVAVGPTGLGALEAPGLEAIGIGQETEVITALLPGSPPPNDPALLFLSGRPWVRVEGDVAEAADRLLAIVHSEAGGLEGGTPECPYRGLAAFSEEDADVFVGREPETQRLVAQLRESGFVAVVGPSGSGKSSLIHAGLAPALRRLSGGSFAIASMTPGDAPLDALARAAGELGGSVSTREMQDDDARLAHAFSAGTTPCLLIVDQMEELFGEPGERARAAFLDNIVHAALVPGVRLQIVLSIRADFFPYCIAHARLRGLLERCQLLLGPMTRHELSRVVTEPARAAGLRLEAGLTDAVLDDVGTQVAPLPLLQYLLLELWRQRQGPTLTLAAHTASGGVKGALARRAESVYADLAPAERAAAESLLLELIRVEPGGPTTRRRLPMAGIGLTAETDQNTTRAIDRLVEARLLTATSLPSGEHLELTHESLIEGWPRFRGWIEDRRDALHRRSRLQDAANDWLASAKQDDLLYSGSALASWDEAGETTLGGDERDFLDASRQSRADAERRRRQGRRASLAAVATLALLLGVVVLLLLDQRSSSREARVAEAGRLAVAAQSELDKVAGASDPDLAALLAQASVTRNPAGGGAEPLREALSLIGGAPMPLLESGIGPRAIVASSDAVAAAAGEGSLAARGLSPTTSPRTLSAGVRNPGALALLPDGLLAVGGAGGSLEIVDPSGQEPRRVLAGHRAKVEALVLTKSGVLVSADSRGAVIRWDPTVDEPFLDRRVLDGRVRHLAVDPAETTMAAAMASGKIVLTGLDGQDTTTLAGHSSSAEWVSFSPDGKRIASAGADGTLRQWSSRSGAEMVAKRISAHSRGVSWVEWGPNGSVLASRGAPGREADVRVWDADSGALTRAIRSYGQGITAADLSPDRNVIIAGLEDGSVRTWPLVGDGPLKSAATSVRTRTEVVPAVEPSSGKVAVALSSGDVALAPKAGGDWQTIGTGVASVAALAFLGEDRLVVGASTGEVRIIRLSDGRILGRRRTHREPITAISVAAGANRIALGSGGRETVLVDVSVDGSPRGARTVLANTTLNALALLPGGEGLITSADSGGRLWRDIDGTWMPADNLILDSGPAFTAAVSGDGGLIAVAGGPTSEIRIWGNGSGGLSAQTVIEGRPSQVRGLAFGPDGSWLAAAQGDGGLAVYSTVTGERLRSFPPSRNRLLLARSTSPKGEMVTVLDTGATEWRSCDLCVAVPDLLDRAGALLGDLRLRESDLSAAGLSG